MSWLFFPPSPFFTFGQGKVIPTFELLTTKVFHITLFFNACPILPWWVVLFSPQLEGGNSHKGEVLCVTSFG